MDKLRVLIPITLAAVMLLVSCRAQTSFASEIAEVVSTNDPLLASSCQVALIGKWQDEGNVIISIRNFAGDYQITRESPDGNNISLPLGVKNVDGVVRFYEDAVNLTGNYWTIGENRALEYYVGDVLIKSLPIME